MIVALEGGRGVGVIKGDLIDRCTRDNEADVCKRLRGIIGACDVRIAEVGAGVVDGTAVGRDRAGSMVKERQQVRRSEGSVKRATGVECNCVVLVAR
jgi:hypothetical protein